MKINILNQDYEIILNADIEKDFEEYGKDGICNISEYKIAIDKNCPDWAKAYTLRHEIIHAFLKEAGYIDLYQNEPFVSILAMKLPYLVEVLNKVKAM